MRTHTIVIQLANMQHTNHFHSILVLLFPLACSRCLYMLYTRQNGNSAKMSQKPLTCSTSITRSSTANIAHIPQPQL